MSARSLGEAVSRFAAAAGGSAGDAEHEAALDMADEALQLIQLLQEALAGPEAEPVHAAPRPLTAEEKERWDAIRSARNIALVQTSFDGQATAVVVAVTPKGDDDVIMTPLAVLLTDEMRGLLANPAGDNNERQAG